MSSSGKSVPPAPGSPGQASRAGLNMGKRFVSCEYRVYSKGHKLRDFSKFKADFLFSTMPSNAIVESCAEQEKNALRDPSAELSGLHNAKFPYSLEKDHGHGHTYFCLAFAFLDSSSKVAVGDGDTPSASATSVEHIALLSYAPEGSLLLCTVGPFAAANIAKALLSGEPRCFWCYRTEAHMENPLFISCDSCGSTRYCSLTHKTEAFAAHSLMHSRAGGSECDILRACTQDQDFLSSRSTRDEITLWASHSRLDPGLGLPSEPWSNYFSPTGTDYEYTPSLLRMTLSVGLTKPLTIIDAFRRLKLSLTSLEGRVTIHVISVTDSLENNDKSMVFEEILHQLPLIKELVIDFISPRAESCMEDTSSQMCLPCNVSQRKLTRNVSSSLYPDFAARNSFAKPDLAIALNSNLCHSAEWSPIIRSLIAESVPCMVTSYNMQTATSNEDYLKDIGARMLWQTTFNRWSGQRIHQDPLQDDPQFSNAFTLGFQGTSDDRQT